MTPTPAPASWRSPAPARGRRRHWRARCPASPARCRSSWSAPPGPRRRPARDGLPHRGLVELAGPQQVGRPEGEGAALLPQLDQAEAALLHEASLPRRHTPGSQPRVGAAQRRMSGERQLTQGCEDPQPVVRRGVGGRQQEGGLGEVRPPGEGRHLRVGEAGGVVHHGHRVAGERTRGEDVDLGEGVGGRISHGPSIGSSAHRPDPGLPRPMTRSPWSTTTATSPSRSVRAIRIRLSRSSAISDGAGCP